MKRKTARCSRRVETVRKEIKIWRRTRAKRAAMPADLWAAAVELAARHGIAAIARGLGIDYGALKRRLAGHRGTGANACADAGFVELRPEPLAAADPDDLIVEFADAEGGRVTFRLPRGVGVDVSAFAAAFWSRPRRHST